MEKKKKPCKTKHKITKILYKIVSNNIIKSSIQIYVSLSNEIYII